MSDKSNRIKTQNETINLRKSVGNSKFKYENGENEVRKVCGSEWEAYKDGRIGSLCVKLLRKVSESF